MKCQWPVGNCEHEALDGIIFCRVHRLLNLSFPEATEQVLRVRNAKARFQIRISEDGKELRQVNASEYEKNSGEIIDCCQSRENRRHQTF